MAPIPTSSDRSLDEWFSKDEREALIEDDAQAWRQVTGLLIAIVVGGVMLGATTVILIYASARF